MSSNPHESSADPAALNEFINSLQRLFKIGIYYPAGHAILDKATDRFMSLLARLAGEKTTVLLQDYGSSILLEGIELDRNLPFVQEFKSLLSALGITALIFDRDITRPEVHAFVKKMLYYKSKVLSAKQFTRIDIEELPHSVTVKLKEFLARDNQAGSGAETDDSAQDLNSFIESLSRYGLSDAEIGQCRDLLSSLPDRLKASNLDMGDLPYASWDDVARLLSRALKKGTEKDPGLKNQLDTQANINALAAILKKLERETIDQSSRSTINLLVSIIRKPFKEAETPAEAEEMGLRVFPEKPAISISQIQGYTTKNRLHSKILANIPETPADNETLSILMLVALREQTLQNQIRMQQLFREILSVPIQEKTWEILGSGLIDLIGTGKTNLISSILRQIIEPLRRSRHANSLHLLNLVIDRCPAHGGASLWPHVVNELLVNGISADPTAFQNLCRFAAAFESEEMQEALPQLSELDAFQNSSVAADIFPAQMLECYPLFAFLLRTDIDRFIGERVLGGFRRHPADWLIKALAPLLDLSLQEHKLFLYSYLRQAARKAIPAALKTVAAKIVTETLPALPQDRRGELWVQESIEALRQLQSPETRALLEQIAREKKLFFIPEWPAECRRAAERALAGGRQPA